MVPTVFGVILITFVLFNIVGGDIAKATLGKHVSPKMLEEFDTQRGFNKPLIFGWWTPTRAYTEAPFTRNPGVWAEVPGAEYRPPARDERGHVVLPPASAYPIPVEFNLTGGEEYRWSMVYRLPDGEARLIRAPGTDGEDEAPEGEDKAERAEVLHRLEPTPRWREVTLPFEVDTRDVGHRYLWEVEGSALAFSFMRLERGVENPWDSQFVHYLKQLCPIWMERVGASSESSGALRLRYVGVDLGTSINTKQRVSQMILEGILPSLSLTAPIFLAGLVTALALSLLCAFFRDRFFDRFFVVLSVALMSINYIVWIVVGQYVLAFQLGWFPVWGYESWYHLALPVLIGVISGLGTSIRFYRTIMLDELYKDYVRTAFAKGVSRTGVLFKHVLKNAMIPVVTNVVITIPFLYTGSLLLESFFGIPGLGYMAINAINSSDVDVVRAVVFIGAVLFVVFNLLTDICYALVDPRVEFR